MKKLHMKTNKLLFVLMIILSSAITVGCSQQIITPAQKRQNIIDDAMKPENYRDLKQDLAFLESQGLLQSDSFYNLLQENVTESDDATFNEVIEKAEDLITEHMRDEFISIIDDAFEKNKSFNYFIDNFTCPLFSYVMQRKDNDMALQNIVNGWLLQWNNARTEGRADQLYCAAARGRTEITQILLAAHVNVNTQPSVGDTPLYAAALNGHAETVQLLLEYGADVNTQSSRRVTPLYMAAQNGYIRIIQLLLAAGENVDIQRKDNGQTSLYIAVVHCKTLTVRHLLLAGANANIETTEGVTPLHMAVKRDYTEIVQLLVQHGADINIRNDHGQLVEDLAKTDEIRDILRRARQRQNPYEVGWCLIS